MSQKKISLGITAFIDVLGFSDRVLSAEKKTDVDAITNDIRKIQSEFEYKPKDKFTKKIHSSCKKTVLAFSDSVIVHVPLESERTKIQGTFDPFMDELSGMAISQCCCVNSGFFLRGGVDLGWWYRRGSTLVSQSMVGAYKCENRANVPIIALTDRLYQFLSKHKHRIFYSEDIEPVRQSLRFYCNGSDSFWYLDYIAIFADEIGWNTSPSQQESFRIAAPDEKQKIINEGRMTNLTTWFTHHARTVERAYQQAERAYKQAKNDHVKKKYEWLASYHNEIAPKYTVSAECLCKLK
ncbi:MAG: hypothetical protein QG657_5636 [Acidobacteriota bacterium]|nr:hypothetical protein [Acidobacteriota bacterium]